MKIDLDHAPDLVDRTLRSQVCIIGGGIAGLVLAGELEAHGVNLTLLEAGGRAPHLGAGPDPFGAEFRGTPHAGTATGRVRAFGGTSNTWGGQLLPLPQDADWPLVAALAGEVRRSAEASEAARFFSKHQLWPPPLLAHLPGLAARVSCFLPFTRRNLARRWGRQLRRFNRVKLVLHATVQELLLAPQGDRVEGVLVRRSDGSELRIEADHFVLAAGTVETCRLLLASRGTRSAGLGDQFGQVGRRFHDHLTCAAAELTGPARELAVAQLRPWIFRSRVGRFQFGGQVLYSLKLEPETALRAQLGIPPAMAHLTLVEPEGTGIGVLRRLLRARQAGALRSVVRGVVRQLPGALAQAMQLVWEARVHHRRYVSPRARVYLQINLAQQPSEAMRVSLGVAIGTEGLPPAVVHWEVSEADLRHIRLFAQYLRERLEAAGWGEGIAWLPGLFGAGEEADAALRGCLDDARHAMGGACMGTDPRNSVVDPELRVHGIQNLSVASAAVFPDGSAQLPTATLMALCKHLAERLRRELV